MVQDTHYFKATLKAVYPSHSEGEEIIVYGVAMYGQVPEEQAIHIGLLQGLGQSIVKKIKFYKSGEAWYNAQYGKEATKTKQSSLKLKRKRHLSTVSTGDF